MSQSNIKSTSSSVPVPTTTVNSSNALRPVSTAESMPVAVHVIDPKFLSGLLNTNALATRRGHYMDIISNIAPQMIIDGDSK